MNQLIRPNLHVVLVHFPMALLVMGLIIEILSLIWRQVGFRTAGRWMILLGTIAAVPTALTGLFALHQAETAQLEMTTSVDAPPQITPLNDQSRELLEDHWMQMTIGTAAVLVIVVAWIGCSDLWRRRLYPIFLLAMMGTVGVFLLGAWHGGEAVYGQGVGVSVTSRSPAGTDHVLPVPATQPIKPATLPADLGEKARATDNDYNGTVTLPRPNVPSPIVEPAKPPVTVAVPAVPAVEPEIIEPEPMTAKPEVPTIPQVPATKPTADPVPVPVEPIPAPVRPEPIPTPIPAPEPQPIPAPEPAPAPAPHPVPPATLPATIPATQPTTMQRSHVLSGFAHAAQNDWMLLMSMRTSPMLLAAEVESDEHADAEDYESDGAFLPPAGSTTEQKVAFYAPPLQMHLIFAGLTIAMSMISLGLSIRVAVNAAARYRAENAQRELAGDNDGMDAEDATADSGVVPSELTEPITVPASPVPASRFWMLAALLALLTVGLGWYTLAHDFELFGSGESFGQMSQTLWDTVRARDVNDGHFLTRRMSHVIVGGSIILLPILMAILARIAGRKKIMLAIFALLVILALAAQVWLGILLLMGGADGPITKLM